MCLTYDGQPLPDVLQETPDTDCIDWEVPVLSYLLPRMKLRPIRRFLTSRNVLFSAKDGIAALRREMKKYILRLKAGKRSEERRNAQLALDAQNREDLHRAWPQIGTFSTPHFGRWGPWIIDATETVTSSE